MKIFAGRNLHYFAGTGIFGGPGPALPDRKTAKTANFHALAVGQGIGDRFDDNIDGLADILFHVAVHSFGHQIYKITF